MSYWKPGAETDIQAEVSGHIAWANKEGDHGIQFDAIPAEVRTHLQRWFQSEMKKDGWHDDLAGWPNNEIKILKSLVFGSKTAFKSG